MPFVNDAPDAAQEPRRAFSAGLAPFQIFFWWSGEQHEQTQRVRAVDIDHLVGIDGVLLRLRHLLDSPDGDSAAAECAFAVFDFIWIEPVVLLAAISRQADHSL